MVSSLHGVPQYAPPDNGILSPEEAIVIQGALNMRNKIVEDSMTKLDKVYRVSSDDKLDGKLLREIRDK